MCHPEGKSSEHTALTSDVKDTESSNFPQMLFEPRYSIFSCEIPRCMDSTCPGACPKPIKPRCSRHATATGCIFYCAVDRTNRGTRGCRCGTKNGGTKPVGMPISYPKLMPTRGRTGFEIAPARGSRRSTTSVQVHATMTIQTIAANIVVGRTSGLLQVTGT